MVRPLSRALAIATLLSSIGLLCAMSRNACASIVDSASADIMQLDSARSQVNFRVKALWLLNIGGRFGKVSGSVRFVRFRNQISVDAHIDVNAISMSSASQEDWVKSSEFFDVAQYPQIDFISEPFPRSRLHEGGDLPGVLTLRGISRPVSFKLRPSNCGRPAHDCPIEVEGIIRRSVFGMHSRHGTLSDRVEMRLEVYAVETAQPTLP